MSQSLPPLPDFSFKPGAPVDTAPAQLALQKQAQQQAQDQQGLNNIHQTIQMASELAQSFVEQSKQRQQRDAIKAFAAFNPNQSVTRMTDAGGTQIGQPAPTGIPSTNVAPQSSFVNGGQPMASVATPTDPSAPQMQQTTLGATPEGQAMQKQLLARVLAGDPSAAASAIAAQTFPKPPSTTDQLLAAQLKAGQDTSGTVAAIQAKKGNSLGSIAGKLNGQDAFANYDKKTGKYFDPTTGQDVSASFTPAPKDSNAEVRKELGVQANLTSLAKDMKATLIDSQPAKTVLSSDNFLNQVSRAKNGKIILDKPTVTAMAAELDRALTGTGTISEQRAKELAPDTLKSKWADIKGYVLNHPEDRDVQSFMDNLAEEVKGRREQSMAAVEQSLRPFMASAKLAQRNDPQGFKDTVESLGLDAKAAAQGKIKFLPGASSVLYGQGKTDTGLTAPTDSAALKDSVRKKLGL